MHKKYVENIALCYIYNSEILSGTGADRDENSVDLTIMG